MAKFFESLAKKEAQSAVDEGGARKGEGGHVAIQSPFQGKACIEVGAGTGIVSLAYVIDHQNSIISFFSSGQKRFFFQACHNWG